MNTNTNFYGYYFIFLLFLSHSIFNLNLLSNTYLFLALVLILFVSLTNKIQFPSFKFFEFENKFSLVSVLVIILIIFPSLYLQYLIFNNDFNWGGDHRDHVQWSLVNTEFWISKIFSERGNINFIKNKSFLELLINSRIFLLFSLIAIFFIIFKIKLSRFFLIPLFLLVYLISYFENITTPTPQATYFINNVINIFLHILNFDFMSGIGITNFLSILFWLLFLRPMILGQWPDWKILPFALIIYWHSEILYFINFGFIEAWSLIFLFTAFELIIIKGKKHSDICCLLIGVGACFKPPVGLFLPFFLLYGISLHETKSNFKLLLSFISAILPLQIFSHLREANSWRWSPIELENYSLYTYKSETFYKWQYRINDFQFYFLIALLFLFLYIVYNILKCKDKKLYIFLLITFLGLFSIYFFNLKLINYFLWIRYYIYSFIPLLIILTIISYKYSKKISIFISTSIILFASINLSNWYEINRNNLYEMNFSGQDAGPIFMGINQIINTNNKILKDKSINKITISRNFNWIYNVPIYLFNDIKLNASKKGDLICDCNNEEAIINFFPIENKYFNNKDKKRFLYKRSLKKQCIEKMELTCSHIYRLNDKSNQTISILGIR
tara:strand:+ start:13698 stop:15539 length:1842 start_codon:yes stop_codon:yes gene_type:complete